MQLGGTGNRAPQGALKHLQEEIVDMNKEKLLKLAALLRADADKPDGIKFDLGFWGITYDPDDDEVEANLDTSKVLTCHTTACAIGLAAISGAFNEDGLGFFINKGDIEFTLHGTKIDGIDAAIKVFDLTYDQASYLFVDDAWLDQTQEASGERQVAERIKRFVKENGIIYRVDYDDNGKRIYVER